LPNEYIRSHKHVAHLTLNIHVVSQSVSDSMPKIFERAYTLDAFVPESQRWKRRSHNFLSAASARHSCTWSFSATSHVNICAGLIEQLMQLLHCFPGILDKPWPSSRPGKSI